MSEPKPSFSVNTIVRQARDQLHGFKRSMWLASWYILLVSIGFMIINMIIQFITIAPISMVLEDIVVVISYFVIALLNTAVLVMGLKRLHAQNTDGRMVFSLLKDPKRSAMLSAFSLNMIILLIVFSVMHSLGNVIGHTIAHKQFIAVLLIYCIMEIVLLLFAIIAHFALYFSMLLVLHHNLPVLHAIKLSYSRLLDHFGKILLLELRLFWLTLLGVISLGIGFIWIGPWVVLITANTYEVLYHETK